MSPEFSAFLSSNGTAIVIVLGVLAAIGLVQWRKVRVAEQEGELKRAMIEKGMPVGEIEKAVAVKPPGRRGLVDQFAALSGGAKTGIIVGGVIVFVVGFGCVAGVIQSIAFWSHVREERAAVAVQPPAEVQPPVLQKLDVLTGNAFYLDLQPLANQKLTDVIGENGHSFMSLPQRRRDFGGVPFQVGPGYVRLRGNHRPTLPAEVNGIRVNLSFDKLHILHGTEYGAFGGPTHRFHVDDGVVLGSYRVRFVDNTEQSIPIVYGQDVRDAFTWDRSRPVSRGRVAWTGHSPATLKEGVSLRLYLTTWTNPRPDVEVASIDYISVGNTAASPFCVALTAERAVK